MGAPVAKYYLGVDGGGTKCRMRLADADLNTLAEDVIEKASNLQVRNGDAAYESITRLLPSVFEKAGIDVSEAENTAACFGIAGGRLKSACRAFEERDFPFTNVKVNDDIDIARAGAHEDNDGGVMIIGTGSAAMALVDGKRYQIGGWGFHVGDTMSGAIWGRELLRRSLLAHDGLIPGSDLTRAVMAEFDNDGQKMMDWSFDNPAARAEARKNLAEGEALNRNVPARPADYGAFAKWITEYYKKGDPVAAELVEFELQAIGEYVDWFNSINTPSLAIVGGVGHSLMSELRERFGTFIVEEEPESLYGAVFLARQLFGTA